MTQSSVSQSENQKEVYKFWLGFFEKVAIVIITVAIIPYMAGQLNYVPGVLMVWTSFFLVLAFIMGYLSRKLWYLPKNSRKAQRSGGEK
ncbi:MAG: hypothetical protein ACREOO_28065 [bacterium]